MTQKNRTDIKDINRTAFDNMAAGYDKGWGKMVKALYPQLEPRLRQITFTNHLDIGFGTGDLLARMARDFNIDQAGIDLAAEMVKMGQKRLPQADLRVGDVEALPWEDGTFDLVTCSFSFHHYPNPGKALSEMRRIIKIGGRLLLVDMIYPEGVRQMFNPLLPLLKQGDVKIYAIKEITTMLQSHGFAVEYQYVKYFKHYIVQARAV